MSVMIRSCLSAAIIATAAAMATVPASAADGRNGAFVGGAALGAVGGVLLGSALANHDRYYDEPPPVPVYEPACYFERRRVPNAYDYGWHVERVRVCD